MDHEAAIAETTGQDVTSGAEGSPAQSGWDRSAVSEAFAAGLDRAEGQATDEGASGGQTPAADGQATQPSTIPPVPYDKFAPVQRENTTLKEQLGQYEPFRDLIQELTQGGYSVQDAFELIQQGIAAQQSQAHPATPTVPTSPQAPVQPPAEALTEAQRFEQFLIEQRVREGWESYDHPLQMAYWNQFQQAEQMRALQSQLQGFQSFQEEQRQAAQAAATRNLELEVQGRMDRMAVEQPLLQSPLRQQAVFGLWRAALVAAQQQGREGPTLEQVGAAFLEDLNGLGRNMLASYAAGKGQDAKVPVVAGGAAPPPVEQKPLWGQGERRGESVDRVQAYLEARQDPA